MPAGSGPEDLPARIRAGALGRKLLTLVEDVMRTGTQVPRVAPDTVRSDLMREMSAKGLGAAAVVDGQERPVGIFTDGDLRRRIEAGADLRQATAAQVMHAGPRTIADQALAVDAAEMMERTASPACLWSMAMGACPASCTLAT